MIVAFLNFNKLDAVTSFTIGKLIIFGDYDSQKNANKTVRIEVFRRSNNDFEVAGKTFVRKASRRVKHLSKKVIRQFTDGIPYASLIGNLRQVVRRSLFLRAKAHRNWFMRFSLLNFAAV